MVRGTLVDANVLIDVLGRDRDWFDWSADALLDASTRGPIVINPIIYGEASVPFDSPGDFDVALGPEFDRRPIPWDAAFLAGKAFQEYRRRGGSKAAPLPDFYIGAHAAVEQFDVLTRDPRRYLSYFRGITVISPSDG